MRSLSFFLILMLAMTARAPAQDVGECDYRAAPQAIAEPWEDNTRTFANGDVRLTLIDTIEPAAAAFHIMVLSPPFDEVGGRQCRVISFQGASGFSGVSFAQLTAGYDPARGLMFEVPVQVYDSDAADFAPRWLNFTLNQASGLIDAWLHAGG